MQTKKGEKDWSNPKACGAAQERKGDERPRIQDGRPFMATQLLTQCIQRKVPDFRFNVPIEHLLFGPMGFFFAAVPQLATGGKKMGVIQLL